MKVSNLRYWKASFVYINKSVLIMESTNIKGMHQIKRIKCQTLSHILHRYWSHQKVGVIGDFYNKTKGDAVHKNILVCHTIQGTHRYSGLVSVEVLMMSPYPSSRWRREHNPLVIRKKNPLHHSRRSPRCGVPGWIAKSIWVQVSTWPREAHSQPLVTGAAWWNYDW